MTKLQALNLASSVIACAFTAAAWAAPTPVAVTAGSPELSTLAACIAERASASGPVVTSARLVDGLEFRLLLRSEPGVPALLIVNALLKPDVASLIASHNHDDHAESQSAAATRFYHLLRVPLGSRAWLWQRQQEPAICGAAAAWVARVRRQPIDFDHIGVDGEAR